ncbi:MAG: electron transport complex subunit RsxD, partial [Aeromonas sp.]
PGFVAQTWFFGWGTWVQLLLAATTALACEALALALRRRPLAPSLFDGSALLTAVLLALAIPPFLPWWMTVLGSSFAILLVKHVYGGLGQNPFNPAAAAYVLLLISFPAQMTAWLPPASLRSYDLGVLDALWTIFTGFSREGYSVEQLRAGIDGFTLATPLDAIKTTLKQGEELSDLWQSKLFTPLYAPLVATVGGVGWAMVNLAYGLGGLFLIKQKAIRWHIPLALLASLVTCSALAYILAPHVHATPLVQLFSGATLFGAFFIATDPVSAATSSRGRLLYGALIGLLTFIIRTWGGYPDGIAFAVLLANLCVPLIDSISQPPSYGSRGL